MCEYYTYYLHITIPMTMYNYCGQKLQTVKLGCCLTLCIHSCVTIALINSWPCIRGMERCCKDIGTSQAGALERSRATSLPPRAPRSHPPAMWVFLRRLSAAYAGQVPLEEATKEASCFHCPNRPCPRASKQQVDAYYSHKVRKENEHDLRQN